MGRMVLIQYTVVYMTVTMGSRVLIQYTVVYMTV